MTFMIGGLDAIDIVAVFLAVMSWVALGMGIANAAKTKLWYRRAGTIILIFCFAAYWTVLAFYRLFLGYHGPSLEFTTFSMILQGAVIVYLFGLSLVQINHE